MLMKPLLLSNHSILGMSNDTVKCVIHAASHKEKASSSSSSSSSAGEGVALERLHHFVGTVAAMASRNLADVLGDNSSRLSVHLSLRTISPRTVYHAAMAAGESCSWLASHLEMRDFFLYTAWSAGAKLYKHDGNANNWKTKRGNPAAGANCRHKDTGCMAKMGPRRNQFTARGCSPERVTVDWVLFKLSASKCRQPFHERFGD